MWVSNIKTISWHKTPCELQKKKNRDSFEHPHIDSLFFFFVCVYWMTKVDRSFLSFWFINYLYLDLISTDNITPSLGYKSTLSKYSFWSFLLVTGIYIYIFFWNLFRQEIYDRIIILFLFIYCFTAAVTAECCYRAYCVASYSHLSDDYQYLSLFVFHIMIW